MANDKDVKRAWLGVDLGGSKILAGVFDDGLSRLARSKTDAKASGGVGPDNVPGSLESIASRSALTRQIQREVKNGRSTLLTGIAGAAAFARRSSKG